MSPLEAKPGSLHPLPAGDDPEALVAALREGTARGAALLFDAFARDVNRLVWRLLGADSEHDDVVQEVFLRALKSIHTLREPRALKGWMVALTVNTVREEIRRRRWRRLVRLLPNDELPEIESHDDHPARAGLKALYGVLAHLPAEERLAFILRYVEGQALEEVAAGLGCSLATAKRRLQRAEARFTRLAAAEPRLAERLAESPRWKP